MKPWNYLLLLIVPALVVLGYYLGGWWNFIVPGVCFIVYPVINLFASSAAEPSAEPDHQYPSWAYRFVISVFVPVLLCMTGWAVFVSDGLAVFSSSFLGLCLSVGIVNGVLGFTLAHEFIHRRSKTERVLGYLLLLQNNYMHYGVEHVWGHHVYACTPMDPVSAKLNESLYAFVPRAIKGTYLSSLKIEKRKKVKRNSGNFFIPNQVILFGFLQAGLMILIFFFSGLSSLLFFILQSVVAICLLHVADYLQHYGLTRKKKRDGNYEKLSERHAWNTGRHNNVINLFQLENHADHHLHPDRSFEKLRGHSESPVHPAGYSFMVILALIPAVWFRIMNERIRLSRSVSKVKVPDRIVH